MVLRGDEERFPPIVATAITVGLVVLPFVALGDVAGLEIVHPAAVVDPWRRRHLDDAHACSWSRPCICGLRRKARSRDACRWQPEVA